MRGHNTQQPLEKSPKGQKSTQYSQNLTWKPENQLILSQNDDELAQSQNMGNQCQSIPESQCLPNPEDGPRAQQVFQHQTNHTLSTRSRTFSDNHTHPPLRVQAQYIVQRARELPLQQQQTSDAYSSTRPSQHAYQIQQPHAGVMLNSTSVQSPDPPAIFRGPLTSRAQMQHMLLQQQ